MPDERYTCRWCLRESSHPDDIVNGYCSCCGSDDILLATPCEHRTGSTLYELFRRGVRLVRREPWPEGDYLELPDHGGFVPPFGLLQRPSARDGAPPDIGYGPGVVPTFRQPAGGWEPYSGPTVEHDRPPTARLKAAWHPPPGRLAPDTFDLPLRPVGGAMPDPIRRLNELIPEERSSVGEEYLELIVGGTMMGAASHGIVVTDEEIRRALLDGTPDFPGTARVTALVRRCAAEQGIDIPEPLFPDRGMTQEGTA